MKKALSMFKPIYKEVYWFINPTGLKIAVLDPSVACAMEFNAEKSAFISFKCEQEVMFCLNNEDFIKALTRFTEDEHLLITIPDNLNSVRVNIFKRGGKALISSNREFTFPIIKPDREYHNYDYVWNNNVKIVSALWKTAMNDMSVGSKDMKGSCFIYIAKDKIRFQVGEAGAAKIKVEYHKSELRSLNLEKDSLTVEVNLALVYDLFKGMPDDLLLEFIIDQDKPIICKFELVDIKMSALSFNKPFEFKLLIAPYVRRDPLDKAELEGTELSDDEVNIPELDEIEDKNKAPEPKEEGLKLGE